MADRKVGIGSDAKIRIVIKGHGAVLKARSLTGASSAVASSGDPVPGLVRTPPHPTQQGIPLEVCSWGRQGSLKEPVSSDVCLSPNLPAPI